MTESDTNFHRINCKIDSTRISDDPAEKKYIIYKLNIQYVPTNKDTYPTSIERRYTDFYNLYNNLKEENQTVMSSFAFPKKALFGNFDQKLISERVTKFEEFLHFILSNSKLTYSTPVLKFLQETELEEIRGYIQNKQYNNALSLVESNYRLLNKVYTYRSPPVILALCRWFACSLVSSESNDERRVEISELILSRFDGISDSDLLVLLLPVLKEIESLWSRLDMDVKRVESTITQLKKEKNVFGKKDDLFEAVDHVQRNLYQF